MAKRVRDLWRILLVLGLLASCGLGPDSAQAAVSAAAAKADASSASATVVVHYPAGRGHRLTLRGTGPLSWTRGLDLKWSTGDKWTASLKVGSGSIQVKPLFDDSTWAAGPNWTLAPGQTLDVWPSFSHRAGSVRRVASWRSNVLGNTRGYSVYVPPSYDENPGERYPVVYMQDGQNLFSDAQSFSGISWDVAGALDRGFQDGSIHEAIIVAIDNNGNRTWEYTPTDGGHGGGGADRYLQAIATELKPQIDRAWRTLPDRAHTVFMGSSLGGLLALEAGLKQPSVFGLLGALSPSTWWDSTWIIGQVRAHSPAQKPLRLYLDSGDSGTDNDDVVNTRQLASVYSSLGVSVRHVVQRGGQHGESWWRQRVPGALQYLLGPR